MTATAAPHVLGVEDVRPPRPLVLGAISLAGCAAVTSVCAVSLTSDRIERPVVHAALLSWITLSYILSGVLAWPRRPESRRGRLLTYGRLRIWSPKGGGTRLRAEVPCAS